MKLWRQKFGIVGLIIVLISTLFTPAFIYNAEVANAEGTEGKLLKDMDQGDEITFADREWIVLEPQEGYIFAKDELEVMRYNPFFKTNEFSATKEGHIGRYLNSEYYESLPPAEQEVIDLSDWDDGTPHLKFHYIGLLSAGYEGSDWSKYKDSLNLEHNPPSGYPMWTITSAPSSEDKIMTINNDGNVRESSVEASGSVRPAMRLDPNILISDENKVVLTEIKFEPNGNETREKEHKTKVTVLNPNYKGIVTFQYNWSESRNTPTSGGWVNFTNGATINTPPGAEHDYYLHIRTLNSEGNDVISDVSEVFKLKKPVMQIREMREGNEINFAGLEWTVLNPQTGYIFSNEPYVERSFHKYGGTNNFRPEDPDNIGYNLNDGFYNELAPVEQAVIQNTTWSLDYNDGTDYPFGPVTAKVGLLSLEEWQVYGDSIGVPSKTMFLRTPDVDSFQSVWVVKADGSTGAQHTDVWSMGHPTLRLDPDLFISGEDDVVLPEVTFAPDGNETWEKEHETTVTVYNPDNKDIERMEYQWSPSPDTPASGEWTNFTSDETIKTPPGAEGEYYLHIRGLDDEENIVLSDVSEVFKLEKQVMQLKEMNKGKKIIFADQKWIVLNPETGYILLHELLENQPFDTGDAERNKFDPTNSNNIGHYLNHEFYNELTSEAQAVMQDTTWSLEDESDNAKYDSVTAKIGLLSLGDWRMYGDTIGNPSKNMWLRTPDKNGFTFVLNVAPNGVVMANTAESSLAVRPALRLDPDVFITEGTVILKEVVFAPNGNETWAKEHEIKVTVPHPENNNVEQLQYQWSTNTDTSTIENWTDFSSGETIKTPSGANDEHYLHIQGVDHGGNVVLRDVSRAFKLDNTNPTTPLIDVLTDWQQSDVSVSITPGEDEQSGVEKTEYRTGRDDDWSNWRELSGDGTITMDEEGEITVQAKTIDNAGNESEVVLAKVKIDRTMPNIKFDPKGNDQVEKDVATKVTVTDEISGLDTLEYIWSESDATPDDQEDWVPFTSGAEIKKDDEDGKWYLHIQAKDNAGNIANAHSNAFHLDHTAPELTVRMTQGEDGAEYESGDWTNEKVNVSINATDDNLKNLQIKMNDQDVETDSKEAHELELNEHGTSRIHITAIDEAGNETSEERTIKIDKKKPDSPSIKPDSKGWTNEEKVVVQIVDGADEGSGVEQSEYRFDEASDWTAYNHPLEITEAGETIIYARTIDKVGNVSSTTEATVKIKRSNPSEPSIQVPTSEWTNAKKVAFTITGEEDPLSHIQYQLNDTDGEWLKYEGSIDIAKEGITTIYARTLDKAGNDSKVVEATVKIDRTAPKLTLEGDNPLNILYGEKFNDPGYDVTDKYTENLTVDITGTVDTTKIGSYELNYSVEDAAGNKTTATRIVNVNDEEQPIITLKGKNPLMLEVGTSYEEPGATAMDNVEGDISEHITITGEVDHTKPGTYEVRYNVSDSSGNAAFEAVREVHVVAPETIDTVLDDLPKLIYPGASITVKETNATIQLPANLPEGTTLRLESVDDISFDGFVPAGEIYNFVFTYPEVNEDYSGDFVLTLGIDDDAEDVAIYHYNEQSNKWEYIGGDVKDGKITATVHHFSMYGVFANVQDDKEKPPADPDDGDKDNGKNEGNGNNDKNDGDGGNKGDKNGDESGQDGTDGTADSFLPKTATDYYNFLLIGLLSLILGTVVWRINRKRQYIE